MLRRFFPNVYEGWIVVGSSAFVILIVAATFFYGFGTIFQPIRDEFGWSVAVTALAFSLRSEAGGIAAPLVGMMVDRFQAQKVMAVGVVTASTGVLLMSFMQELWHFYAVVLIIAIGSSAVGGQVGLVATATWFRKRRALAMSLMTVGGGLGGVFVVGVAWLVETYGWRDALRVMFFIMLVFGLLASTNVRKRPRGHPQPMDGARRAVSHAGESLVNSDDDELEWGVSLRHALRTRAFVLMSLTLIATSFSTTALIVHQIPFLEQEFEVSKSLAGLSVAMFTVSSMVGRLGFAWFADRKDKRLAWILSASLIVVGLPILMLATTLWQVILAILLIAPGFGGTIPVRPALLVDYFGLRSFGSINGTAHLVFTTGGFAGPLVVGVLVDATGDYTMGWGICAAVTAITIPALLLLRRPAGIAETPPTGQPVAGARA